MAYADASLTRRGFGQTMRPDAWWVQPSLVLLGLSAFIVYSTWAALQGAHYRWGPYLSPFYSPELFWKAMWFSDAATGKASFGVGLGTVVLAVNVILLGGYTFGCHSLRHLVGGGIDRLSEAPLCQRTYRCVSCFNRRHMLWAWMSLFWVAFSDLYVRLCSMGVWHDVRIF